MVRFCPVRRLELKVHSGPAARFYVLCQTLGQKHWARKGKELFIPVEEVVAAIWAVSAEQCKAAIAFLVSLRKLIASPTGGGHKCELQVVDLDTFLNPLPELQWRVLKYHIAAQTTTTVAAP